MKKLLVLAFLFPLSAFARPPGGPGPGHGPGGVHIGIGFSGYYGPYYYPYGYWGPYYDYPPTVVYQQPDVVVQAPPTTYWYYCDSAKAYYPYVQQCPEGWRAVPANPPQTSQNGPAPQAAATPAPQGSVTYSLGDVLFDTGSATLRAEATAVLDSVVASLNNEPNRRIVISGHTDNVGDASANVTLSG
ncbi:MAG: OmpA family protein, partial [Solimonas sp.]